MKKKVWIQGLKYSEKTQGGGGQFANSHQFSDFRSEISLCKQNGNREGAVGHVNKHKESAIEISLVVSYNSKQ